MWRWAFDQFRIRKARKAVVATICPMVERSRLNLGGISDASWSDPYIVGFMMMLITIIAKSASRRIEGDALCIVQTGAWEDITLRRSDLIGEDLLLLSEAQDPDFSLGCQDALSFGSMLVRSEIRLDQSGPLEMDMMPTQREEIFSAWAQLFDQHVAIERNGSISTVV